MAGEPRHSYEVAKPQEDGNWWTCCENNATNAWNLNASDGNLNNNNNKYNQNDCRAVAASDGFSEFYASILYAYYDCLRGKMNSTQAVEYMQIAAEDLPRLAKELWEGTYTPGTSTCFLVHYPKLREVFAANFRDRIVHHWICLRLEPLFEQRFESMGDVTFNCRKGFGTERCVSHFVEGARLVSDSYRKVAWSFKGDIVGFFMAIDKELLWYLLERFITRWKKRYEREGWYRITPGLLDRLKMDEMPVMYWDILLMATRTTVMHHPERNCVLNSPVEMWLKLAPNKSLFTCETGEPIGNLTTQLFANFLMSFFDMYVLYLFRHKQHSYERFVDDWSCKCEDRDYLIACIPKMEAFLRDKLRLEMHRDKRYLQPVSHGTPFVGSYIKPGRIYLANRTLARFEERVNGFRRMMLERQLSCLDCKRIEQVINSYLGFCKGKRTYRRRRQLLDSMGKEFYRYFYIRGHYQSIRTKREYRMLNP